MEDVGVWKAARLPSHCMFIHPDMLCPGAVLGNCPYSVVHELPVSPTSSGRTVFALDDEYFIKLAYPGYLGRAVRHMNSEVARAACAVTEQLAVAMRSEMFNRAFSILREDCGRVLHIPQHLLNKATVDLPVNGMGCYEWGVIFRDFRPFPYLEEEEYLIPGFALFGREFDPHAHKIKEPQDKPLLIQLFEHQRKAMDEFLLESILFPLFHSYFDALLLAGVELEAHAQNILFTVGRDFSVKRVVYRDMESAGRDVPLMRLLGMDVTGKGYKENAIAPALPGDRYAQYCTTHSFMFDFKLGEYLVTPLINVAYAHTQFDKQSLKERIRAFNMQFIHKLPHKFFPQEWCYYDRINWRQTNRRRVYTWQQGPQYR